MSTWKIYRNLAIVWITTGIWHGASWNFVLWGVYYGAFIILEKVGLKKVLDKLPNIVRHIYTLIIVIVGWVLFSKNTLKEAVDYIKVMFGIGDYSFINGYTTFYLKNYIVVLIVAIILSTPIIKWLKDNRSLGNVVDTVITMTRPIILPLALIISILYLVNSTFNPFIYFNF